MGMCTCVLGSLCGILMFRESGSLRKGGGERQVGECGRIEGGQRDVWEREISIVPIFKKESWDNEAFAPNHSFRFAMNYFGHIVR